MQARGQASKVQEPQKWGETFRRPLGAKPRCDHCGKTGHRSKDCWRGTTKPGSKELCKEKEKFKELTCWKCFRKGHIAAACPESTSMYCAWTQQKKSKSYPRAVRTGLVEGIPVQDIMLDTGSNRTLIRRDLVPTEKPVEGEISVRWAHGDVITYPLAKVAIEIGGEHYNVEAGVVDRLPVSILVGWDVPQLVNLLQDDSAQKEPRQVDDSMAVIKRAQKKNQQKERAIIADKEHQSGALPHPVHIREPSEGIELELDDEIPGSQFDEELFTESKTKHHLSRSQRRENNFSFIQKQQQQHPLEMTAGELAQLQEEDSSLETVRRAVKGEDSTAGSGFVRRDGLIYRKWTPPGQDFSEGAIEQLVLPTSCRKAVLQLAHAIPLAGHLGRKKTAQRILQRFYWPNMFKDAAEFCTTCQECQKTAPGKKIVAPLIPLPIIEEPFQRIAMDIVGPLPRSYNGNKYVLVICDYATRYPEAIPLRSIDAEHIAEELIKMFSRVGIPREILTDQRSNFTSQLLSEVYRLLHIQPIRTSPYHPQTDGLVERFNQTLKAMLRRTANEEGKDWDKWVPYLLFAYREVPQSSTRFSPFELVYGHQVKGPLDVLKESWENSSKSNESVVSYVLSIQEKLAKMSELARENLAKAQQRQKRWYDENARERQFEPGDQVLVLLPTETSKLLARWHGPYPVLRRISPVNYEVNMYDKKKHHRIFHINMLRKWHAPSAANLLAEDVTEDEQDEILLWDKDLGLIVDQPVIGEQLEKNQHTQLQELLTEFKDVLSNQPGRTNVTEHTIETGDAHPIRLQPYRLPYAYTDTVRQELKDMEESGIIEPSSSNWAAPIVLVKKKDGTLRICVDYQKLNSQSRADAYPMPRIDELIDRLGQAKFVTTLDLTRGYWQVPVEESAREKTAFVTPFGLYQFRVMPFGLQGAPATFQRMMDKLTRGLEDSTAAYLDDLVIFSHSWEEHLQHIQRVLHRLRAAGLTVKPKKCQFAMRHCTYLGHIVGNGMVRPEPSKIAAVRSFKRPQTKKHVRAFLGVAGYYRKFIPNFASIATPLTDLIRKDCPNRVVWTPRCEIAFQNLKKQLCSDPVLRSPDFTKQFIVQTDASDRGVGAVLSQLDDNNDDHPVAYFSRKLLPREEKYSTIEKECLAIKLAVHAFHVYLLGRPFTIQTDHRSLEWLDRLKDNNSRLTRWSLALQPYDFQVEYRTGKANANADGLSRIN